MRKKNRPKYQEKPPALAGGFSWYLGMQIKGMFAAYVEKNTLLGSKTNALKTWGVFLW